MGNNNGLNKITLIGNIGQQPKIYNGISTSVINFSLCTNESIKVNGPAGQTEKCISEWHQCVAFGKLAEIINNYGNKGRYVYVEGRVTHRSFEGNIEVILPNGKKVTGKAMRYKSEVRVNFIKFLDRPLNKSTKTNDKDNNPLDNYPINDSDIPF